MWYKILGLTFECAKRSIVPMVVVIISAPAAMLFLSEIPSYSPAQDIFKCVIQRCFTDWHSFTSVLAMSLLLAAVGASSAIVSGHRGASRNQWEVLWLAIFLAVSLGFMGVELWCEIRNTALRWEELQQLGEFPCTTVSPSQASSSLPTATILMFIVFLRVIPWRHVEPGADSETGNGGLGESDSS